MNDIDELKNMLIVWAVSMEFIDLATLLNKEQSLPDYIQKCIIKDNNFITERDNQLVIQKEKLTRDTDVDKQARMEKIDIIQNQRDGIAARVKFYKETLEDLKK